MACKKPADIVAWSLESSQNKVALSWQRLAVLGFLAGAYIALGGFLALVIGGGVPALKAANPGLQKLLFGGVFPVGLMFVVIAGAELFTGNAAVLIPALLRRRITWQQLAKNWGLSYVANFAGSLLVAWLLAYQTGLLLDEPWLSSCRAIAEGKVAQPFWPLFCKAIGCNWLVCLAVWLAAAIEDGAGKLLAIWFPIMAFVALGFEHCVANMFFVPSGIFYGADLSWGAFLLNNLLPVTLGNLVGGGLFVGGLYGWLYTTPEKDGAK